MAFGCTDCVAVGLIMLKQCFKSKGGVDTVVKPVSQKAKLQFKTQSAGAFSLSGLRRLVNFKARKSFETSVFEPPDKAAGYCTLQKHE